MKRDPAIAALALGAALALVCLPAVRGQTPPLAADQQIGGGFERFIPDQAGEIAWVLKGTMAKFLSRQMIEIGGLLAQSYDPETGDLKIQVDRVIFNSRTTEVSAGDERVTLRREGMVLTGRGIAWDPKAKTVRVMEDIRVLIKEQGNQGLFPL